MSVRTCACGDHCFKVVQYIWVVLVSPEDEPYLSTVKIRKSFGYLTVQRRPRIGGDRRVYKNLPRLITGVPDGLVPDHKNRNSLDNRRSNLRIATYSQNAANSKDRQRNQDLPRGVRASGAKFTAQISFQKRYIHLGTFPTAESAGAAYQAARIRYFGEFAPELSRAS